MAGGRSTRAQVVELVRKRPDWTVTRIAEEVGVTETRVRTILTEEGLATRSQWRASRRLGVKVVWSEDKQTPARPEESDSSSDFLQSQLDKSKSDPTGVGNGVYKEGTTAEGPPVDLAASEWEELRALPSYFEPLGFVRDVRFKHLPREWTPAGIGALETFERFEKRSHDLWSESILPCTPPPSILLALPPQVAGPLARLNLLFAAVDGFTKGFVRVPSAPIDVSELTRAILNRDVIRLDDPLTTAWARVETARIALSGGDDPRSTTELQIALAWLFRAQGLRSAAERLIRLERQTLLSELSKIAAEQARRASDLFELERATIRSRSEWLVQSATEYSEVQQEVAVRFQQSAPAGELPQRRWSLLRESWILLLASSSMFEGNEAQRIAFSELVKRTERGILHVLSTSGRGQLDFEVLSLACRAAAALELGRLGLPPHIGREIEQGGRNSPIQPDARWSEMLSENRGVQQ